MKKKIKNYGLGIALAVILGVSLSLISQVGSATEPGKIPCNSNCHVSSEERYTPCTTCIMEFGIGYNDGKCNPN